MNRLNSQERSGDQRTDDQDAGYPAHDSGDRQCRGRNGYDHAQRQFTVVDITIEEAATEDLETLQLLIQSAFNDASVKLQQKLQDEGLKAVSMMGQS